MMENELSLWAEVREGKYKQADLIRQLIEMEDAWHDLSEDLADGMRVLANLEADWHDLSDDLAYLRQELATVELNLHAVRAEIDDRFPVSPKKEY